MGIGTIVPTVFFSVPRISMVVILIATNWFKEAFNTTIWPIVGFIFAPYTTLAYMTSMLNNDHKLSGVWVLLLILGVLIDFFGAVICNSIKDETNKEIREMLEKIK